MAGSNRKQTVADKERIFEELQDLVSDQLKVCWRPPVSTELMYHSAYLAEYRLLSIHRVIYSSPMIALSYWWSPNAFRDLLRPSRMLWPAHLRDPKCICLQAISYKWLARHFSVPANDAKRLLFEFAEKHRNKVASTYLVAGWTEGANPHHTVQLVDASAVADRRSKLDPVTSLHVYSIQPTAPKARKHVPLAEAPILKTLHHSDT